jgi:hypothetical protein
MSSITIRVPFTVRQRGGRKVVVAPEGTGWAPPRAQVDSTLVKAIARAFRWRRALESGRYGTAKELAAAERVNLSYLCRVLRLTLLAPDIVEAVLDGRQPAVVTLPRLLEPCPEKWDEQRIACRSESTLVRPAPTPSAPMPAEPWPAVR